MSDPQENDGSKNLSDWTLVDSQGEIMSGDGDSESSESSIEVVSVEGNEVVSCRFHGGRNLEQETVVVTENSPSAFSASEENSSSMINEDTGKETSASSHAESVGQPGNLAVGSPLTVDTTVPTSEKDVTSSKGTISSHEALRDEEDDVPGEDETPAQSANSIHTSVIADTVLNDDESGDEQTPSETDEDADLDDHRIDNIDKSRELVSTDYSSTLPDSGGEFNIGTSEKDETSEVENGACCMELLKRSSGSGGDGSETSALHPGDVEGQGSPSPAPVSFKESGILQVSGGGATRSISSRSDSDTDSDFVRLDSDSIDNIDAFVQEHEGSEERVVIPLKLYRTGSSIGPGFSFMRNEEPGELNAEDEDRDDDTESSTEEGVDDRIESEQSEAGSLSAQNDVGDLSVFADIGDLPLEAGDVPRNYIHRPNNHLSTVLNIIVVLAAILTMGISLGIIMATDLEIEEWQNAYEVQTKRVDELENKLHWKTDELRRAQELRESLELRYAPELKAVKTQLSQARSIGKAYELALQVVAEDSSSKDEKFQSVLQLIQNAVREYDDCRKEPSKTTEVCASELHPYAKVYTIFIEDVTFGPIDHIISPIRSYVEQFAQYINKKLDEELEEPEPEFEKEKEGTSVPSEHKKEPATGKKPEAPAKSQASPIDLDIKQLQQSLTREQERAMHWQQLYLMERRQREKERENEEWEDEREREMWEKEKERMDELECMKKLMSANVTTLMQHVTKWNVSVFDDFANLSMLMSGVAELKQSVVNSINRVWESAEELIDNMQAYDENQEGTKWRESIPKQEKLVEYLNLYLDLINRNFMPNKEILHEFFSRMLDDVKHGTVHLSQTLDDIKHGITDIIDEVNRDTIMNSLRQMWEDPEEMIEEFVRNEKGVPSGEKRTLSSSDKEIVMDDLLKIVNDIQDKLEDVVDKAYFREDEMETEPTQEKMVREESDNISPDGKKEFDEDDDQNIPPSSEDSHFEEEEDSTRHGFWSKKLGKVLKKTSKVVRKFGRKIVNTWGKVKTIWHGKLRDAAKRFTSKFSKFGMKWHRKLFKGGKQEVHDCANIHSKCVYKARKQWQHHVLRDPCETLGKFSLECNSGKKKCKKDLKEISHAFSLLLSIPIPDISQIASSSQKDVKLIHDQFELFLQQWGNSKLLLKTDISWAACQASWWSSVVQLAMAGNVGTLKSFNPQHLTFNHCDFIQLEDNFCDGHCDGKYDRDNEKFSPPHEKQNDDEYEDHYHHEEKEHAYVDDDDDIDDNDDDENEEDEKENDDHQDEKEYHQDYILDSDYDEMEWNETAEDQDYADWYLERARYRLQSRREKEKADWVFEMAADREQQRKAQWNEDEQLWVFKKAKDREHQRAEDHKSDWLFERADDRRSSFTRKWMEDEEKDNGHSGDRKRAKKSGRWFTDRAKKRQKKREEEHQSDWVFERAADRRKDHNNEKHHSEFKKHHHNKESHENHFRHAHGKASRHGKFRHSYGRVVTPP